MELIKTAEQYNLKDKFNDADVVGTLNYGNLFSLNINCTINTEYYSANYNNDPNMPNGSNLNISGSGENLEKFASYFMKLIEEIKEAVNK